MNSITSAKLIFQNPNLIVDVNNINALLNYAIVECQIDDKNLYLFAKKEAGKLIVDDEYQIFLATWILSDEFIANEYPTVPIQARVIPAIYNLKSNIISNLAKKCSIDYEYYLFVKKIEEYFNSIVRRKLGIHPSYAEVFEDRMNNVLSYLYVNLVKALKSLRRINAKVLGYIIHFSFVSAGIPVSSHKARRIADNIMTSIIRNHPDYRKFTSKKIRKPLLEIARMLIRRIDSRSIIEAIIETFIKNEILPSEAKEEYTKLCFELANELNLTDALDILALICYVTSQRRPYTKGIMLRTSGVYFYSDVTIRYKMIQIEVKLEQKNLIKKITPSNILRLQ